LVDTGFMPFGDEAFFEVVSGTVQSVKDNKINLKIYPLEPLSDPALDNRIVTISNDTAINILVFKDTATYEQEMQEFNTKLESQASSTPEDMAMINPPEMYINQKANLSDIKPGSTITVTAQEDIKDKKEFQAANIQVQPGMGAGQI